MRNPFGIALFVSRSNCSERVSLPNGKAVGRGEKVLGEALNWFGQAHNEPLNPSTISLSAA